MPFVSRSKFLAAALAIAFVAALPLLAEPGLLNTRGGGDSPFLLQRVHQLETAVLQGHFPARWMPDANYGYGYPFFNYYAPLSIYITLLFRLIGFSYARSIQLSQLAGFLVAAWGMFHLGRRWFKSDWAGILAAVAYTAAPFHMVNVYTRGDSLAEFWAMAFYPLVIWAAEEVASGEWRVAGGKSRIALFALAYAGLILSHNISAMIFSPFLLLYIFLRWLRRPLTINHSQFIIHCSSALLLALALSAWFFVPALAEQSLAQLGPVTEGYFHFSNHFRGADLVQGSFFFDYNPDGGAAFRMGLVQALTAVLGLIILLVYRKGTQIGQIGADKKGNQRSSAFIRILTSPRAFIFFSLLIATFMITPLSRPLWEHLPLLSFTQFPWRFLSVQAFAGALATAGLASLSWRKWIAPGTAVLLLAAGLGNLQTDHLTLTDADVTAEKLAQYEWFTGNIGTTVSAEYLPRTVQPRSHTSAWLTTGERDTVRAFSGEVLSIERANERMTQQIWQVETADSATLIFPTLYWPGWVGKVDGEAVEIRPSPGSGLIMLDAPPGKHTISLQLKRIPIRLAAELASLTAVFITIWLLRPARLPTYRRLKPRRSHGLALAALAALAVGLRLWPEQNLSAGDLTWDFAQMGYLHHDSDGVQFDNGVVLRRYDYSHNEVAAGETVAITLDWQVEQPTEATLALTTPAKNRNPQVPHLTLQTEPAQDGPVIYELVIPANAPPGLYAPRLTLADGRPLMPSGKTRGELYLRPLRIIQSPAANHQPPATTLEVQAVQAKARDGALGVQLTWLTSRPLSHNYNVSLRLLARDGRILSQFDTQPGYGFLPSSGWQVQEWVNDWLALPLPATLADGAPYALVAHLYEVETGQVVLARRLGQLDESLAFRTQEPVFVLPDDVLGETAVFANDSGPIIQLAGYTRQDTTLTLYWRALAPTPRNYTRFVHFINPTNGEIAAQTDGYPKGNSYPTSQWTPDEIIADVVTAPGGAYEIVVGFYENLGDAWPRLTAVAPDGSPFPDDRVPLVNN